VRFPEPEPENEGTDGNEEIEDLDPDKGKSEQQVIDEITGQLNLFPDDNEKTDDTPDTETDNQ
jgi:topoisomerase-4 subunit A